MPPRESRAGDPNGEERLASTRHAAWLASQQSRQHCAEGVGGRKGVPGSVQAPLCLDDCPAWGQKEEVSRAPESEGQIGQERRPHWGVGEAGLGRALRLEHRAASRIQNPRAHTQVKGQAATWPRAEEPLSSSSQ